MADKPIKPTEDGGSENRVSKAKHISNKQEIAEFLKKVEVTDTSLIKAGTYSGRLLFVMDATASRQPTWDKACHLQTKMFSVADKVGGLAMQLCYYRGFNEFEQSPWLVDTTELSALMARVQCLGGYTQIAKALRHAVAETRVKRINAVVIVSDAMEEHVDELSNLAGQLGVLNTPIFAFQEGRDPIVTHAFMQMAHLSGGAFGSFNENSAQELEDLLAAVAVYAAGGRKALERFSNDSSNNNSNTIKLLTQQLKR